MQTQTPTKLSKILGYLRYLPDIIVVVLIILAVEKGLLWLVVLAGITFGVYQVYKGWDHVVLLMRMIDVLVFKWKRRNKHDKPKD